MNDIAAAPVSDCLPQGWAEATLDEITEINPAIEISRLPRDLPVSFVPMPAVSALTGHIDTSTVRPLLDVSKGYTRFIEDDILFAKITPCMENGKIAIAHNLSNGLGFGSTEFHVIRTPRGISNRYVFFFFLRDAFRNVAEQNMKGTAGQRRVPADFLEAARIPVPPESEQERIVARIDELFSELDVGVASLKRARALLKKYRQAVLKAAVTGELTRDWRARHKGEIRETGSELLQRIFELKRLRARRKPFKDDLSLSEKDLSAFPRLPTGWAWVALGRLVSDGPTNGYSPKSGHDAKGTLSLKLSATTRGHLVLTNNTIKHLHENLPLDSKYWLDSGDILIQRANSLEYVGATAIFEGPKNTYIYPDLMMRIRVEEPMLRIFLWRYFNSQMARSYFKSKATGTAGNMPKINADILKRLPVPLPSLEELNAIEEHVAEASVIVDHVESDLAKESVKLQALRQSILKAAFAGRLVAQDPDDEPAGVLLARIRAERAAKPRPARGRRRRAEAGAGRQLKLLG